MVWWGMVDNICWNSLWRDLGFDFYGSSNLIIDLEDKKEKGAKKLTDKPKCLRSDFFNELKTLIIRITIILA